MKTQIDSFNTIESSTGPVEFLEKGSRFIAFVSAVETESQVKANLDQLRIKYHDCSHVCYAFRIGLGNDTKYRFSDDGEPGGTAGKPIFQEIEKRGLFNLVIAVVRYFGGTKLGTGGLSRAYQKGASEILNHAKIISIPVMSIVKLQFSYENVGEVRKVLAKYKVKQVRETYGNKKIALEYEVPVAKVGEIRKMLVAGCKGNITFETS